MRKKKPKSGSVHERLLQIVAWAQKTPRMAKADLTFVEELLSMMESSDWDGLRVDEINRFQYILEKYGF